MLHGYRPYMLQMIRKEGENLVFTQVEWVLGGIDDAIQGFGSAGQVSEECSVIIEVGNFGKRPQVLTKFRVIVYAVPALR